MFIPLPFLIAFAVVFVLLAAKVAFSARRRDPLLGGQTLRPARATRPTRPALPIPLTPEVEAEVRALIAERRKIDAIKLARDATGLDLKGSKDLVESME